MGDGKAVRRGATKRMERLAVMDDGGGDRVDRPRGLFVEQIDLHLVQNSDHTYRDRALMAARR